MDSARKPITRSARSTWSVSAAIRGEFVIFAQPICQHMSRHQLVDQALQTLSQLPEDKISEVIDFASFVLKRHEEAQLQQGITQLVATSDTFAFLHDEEDLYTLADLKERYP
jgi:hypothetical protein